MATLHGHLPEYDGNSEDWTVYAEQLKHYFIANDIESEAKQRSLLLSVCGASTFKLIKTLLPGTQLEETTFAQIVELVKQHHNPQPSEIVQRFHFNSCVRQQGESVASFVCTAPSPLRALQLWRLAREYVTRSLSMWDR